MTRRRRRRFAGGVTVLIALAFAGTAVADPHGGWTGSKGPFSWEAKRLTCGNVGDSASRLRAHTRWRLSPANGYVRLTFTRELKNTSTGAGGGGGGGRRVLGGSGGRATAQRAAQGGAEDGGEG